MREKVSELVIVKEVFDKGKEHDRQVTIGIQ